MVSVQTSRAVDFGITLLTVPASVFLIGHVAALFPETSAIGWASAAAFTAIILAYATLIGPGRRSGAGAFVLGAIVVAPIWMAWLGWAGNLGEDSWYILTFGGFRLGLSDRGFGHAGDIWLFLWIGSILSMIGVALVARRALIGVQPSGDAGASNAAGSTTLKDGLITFGAIYLSITAAGNLANCLWMWVLARPASLVLFAVLVGLYAIGTGPGRRTGWRTYLLCGFFLWGALWSVMIAGYMFAGSYDAFSVFEMFAAGFVVKVEMTDAYTPFAITEILRVLEIASAVALVPILRQFVRKSPDD